MTKEERFQKELEEFKQRRNDIFEKANKLIPLDGFAIFIERIDTQKLYSVLFQPDASKKDKIRESSVGRILVISDQFIDDEVALKQKEKIKIGDCVHYNPEGAYHLMIKDYYEIWALHVNNIIAIDPHFDQISLFEKALRTRFDLQK